MYETAPHIADLRLKLKADSLKNLFETALEGMSEILKKGLCKRNITYETSCKISFSSIDQTALLIDFLSEVLTLSHIKNEIYCKVKFTKLESNTLIAEIFGTKIDKFDTDIKAVSYHEADVIITNKGHYRTNIIFDI